MVVGAGGVSGVVAGVVVGAGGVVYISSSLSVLIPSATTAEYSQTYMYRPIMYT